MDTKKILAELHNTQLFDGNLVLEPISGGLINQSYRLKCDEDAFFIKTFAPNHFFPTDRQALFFQQQRLADLGRAPFPVYLSNAHDFQVEAWIEHTSLQEQNLSIEAKVTTLAETLWEIHQLPTVATSIDLPKDWLTYVSIAQLNDDIELNNEIETCRQIWVDTHKTEQVLCHNDLAMEHVAMTESGVIFDWEYAALGNRYFDLVSCAIINQLTSSQTELLLSAYARCSDIEVREVRQGFRQQQPIVELTHTLWYAAVKSLG